MRRFRICIVFGLLFLLFINAKPAECVYAKSKQVTRTPPSDTERPSTSKNPYLAGLLAEVFPGAGEKSEFRGFQYPAFSQLTGSPWVGNALQSLSFGICHTRWGVCTSPYGTGQLFRATDSIDSAREYVASSSPSDGGNTPDLTYLLQTAVYGFWWGWIVHSEANDLLKAITSHALTDALLITSDLLTTNNTGRLYLSVSIPFL